MTVIRHVIPRSGHVGVDWVFSRLFLDNSQPPGIVGPIVGRRGTRRPLLGSSSLNSIFRDFLSESFVLGANPRGLIPARSEGDPSTSSINPQNLKARGPVGVYFRRKMLTVCVSDISNGWTRGAPRVAVGWFLPGPLGFCNGCAVSWNSKGVCLTRICHNDFVPIIEVFFFRGLSFHASYSLQNTLLFPVWSPVVLVPTVSPFLRRFLRSSVVSK